MGFEAFGTDFKKDNSFKITNQIALDQAKKDQEEGKIIDQGNLEG